jgi:hypothetical protein
MNNPKPKRKAMCLYLIHVAQLIKDRTGSGENYIDSHWECTKIKQRISKRHCLNCTMYKIANNGKQS